MKNIRLVFLAVFIFTISGYAQMRHFGHNPGMEKIEQLEKIKLIETLKMDEETTLRFFARRSEMMIKTDSLMKTGEEIINKMAMLVDDKTKDHTKELKTLINKFDEVQKSVQKLRSDFVKSLDDILTTEQIAKMIIFDRNFKDELRRVLIRGKKPKFRD